MANQIRRLPVSSGEVLNALSNYAKSYHNDKDFGVESVLRNKHMNDLTGKENIDPKVVDAVVVDFINYIGACCGVDYAMYTSDLDSPQRE